MTKINLEKILEALSREKKLIEKYNETKAKIREIVEQITQILNLEDKVSDIKVSIEDFIKSSYKISEENFTRYIVKEISETIEDEELVENIHEIIRDKWKEIEHLLINGRKLARKARQLKKRAREVFGVIDGDILTLERLVKLVYKCLKYTIEE